MMQVANHVLKIQHFNIFNQLLIILPEQRANIAALQCSYLDFPNKVLSGDQFLHKIRATLAT
jgi:hypothetical protein